MAASEERRFQALVLAPVRRVQRRLNAVAWAEAGIAPVWASATACVLARLLLRGAVVWALPPLLAAGFAWWFWRARSRGVSLEQAAVLADRSANAGGLLLTRLERPVGEWEFALNQLASAVKPPEVKWRRPVGALLGALLFLVAGFLLPLPASRGRPVNAAAAAKVAAVQAQAEALAQEEVLDEAVEDELRRLAQEVAEGRFDSGDWEAADAMEKRLAEEAAEAAAELARASEAARELEDALGAAGGAEAAAREREELERALMALSGGDPNAPEDGSGDSEQAPGEDGQQGGQEGASQQGEQQAQGQQGTQGQHGEQGQQGQQGQSGQQGQQGQQGQKPGDAQARARSQASGSPDQIASLRESLERRRQALENRFDPQKAQARQQAGEGRPGNRSGQGRSGKGQRGSGSGEEGAGDSEQGSQGHASRNVREGSGAGVSRGGGSKPLVFGGEAEMDPDRLAFEPLPPGQGGDEAEELWGLEAANPRPRSGPAGAVEAQGTQARGDATAGPGAAPLLPRNRDLVKRYFGGE